MSTLGNQQKVTLGNGLTRKTELHQKVAEGKGGDLSQNPDSGSDRPAGRGLPGARFRTIAVRPHPPKGSKGARSTIATRIRDSQGSKGGWSRIGTRIQDFQGSKGEMGGGQPRTFVTES